MPYNEKKMQEKRKTTIKNLQLYKLQCHLHTFEQ